jgi:hypothetical protein
MKIGFLSNQLDNRGTGNALFNYAHYNEEILGNESIVYSFAGANHHYEAYRAFADRFVLGLLPIHMNGIDALYHIKSGEDDGFRPDNDIPYFVHSVFDNQPHGTVYATISPWMGTRFNLPYVPHVVEVFETNEDLRQYLDIPKDAVVFGRYGGLDSFDITFVHEEIVSFVESNPNVYFLFMNTDRFADHPRIIHMEGTVYPPNKRKFINTCDAMIHARARGETFGIAVGEFAICGKPIITYSESHEKAHLQELGQFALTYNDANTLRQRFEPVVRGPLVSWGYGQYTPENVMKKFKEVYLDAAR